ncbi:phosphopantetheine-binding protein [Streptomyces lichenis]|uniref:Phosphopantetheine-binding protein n=1 Tax=Streptomyces lichenis TaxID=2306967 RepID=A0ABT0I444_9ACTN|nr:phosphopantetheine-binding protein [Streptomyces lichenis]MCK8676090.1 phosphopantetheine-binding protein [Streptomyces lichenis]
MADSYPAITRILTESFGVEADALRPDATFDELELDSLALVELSLLLEERTGHRLEELPATATLAEATAAVDRLVAGEAEPAPAAADAGTSAPTAVPTAADSVAGEPAPTAADSATTTGAGR